MKTRLIYILSSLIFCVGSIFLLMEPTQNNLLLCLGLPVLLTLVHIAVWMLGPGSSYLSYSVALLPCCLFELGVAASLPMLHAVAGIVIAVFVFIPKHLLPTPRPSTSRWTGSLCFLLEMALLAGIIESL